MIKLGEILFLPKETTWHFLYLISTAISESNSVVHLLHIAIKYDLEAVRFDTISKPQQQPFNGTLFRTTSVSWYQTIHKH